MSEFGRDWEGWQLKTSREDMFDRIVDPLGGLVLVETGVDAHKLLQAVEAQVDEVLGPTNSERTEFWTYGLSRDLDGRLQASGRLKDGFKGQGRRVADIYATARDIMAPLEESLMPSEPMGVPSPSLAILAQRRSQLGQFHIDYNLLSMWLGSTQPGFRVKNNEEWLTIDDVPVGHALLWRGHLAHTEGINRLSAVPHYSKYRAKLRRLVLLA